MRKSLFLLILGVMGIIPLSAQTGAFNGFCENGGKSAATQGLNSTNKLNQIIPSCTVNVYLTGTLTPATIYKDAINTSLSNPFTADSLVAVAPGKWLFFAATGQGYDVVMSGGIAPLTYVAPVTLTDLIIGGGSGGAQTIVQVNGVATSPVSPVNFVNSGSVTWSLTGATISATAAASGTIPVWPNIYYSAAAPSNSFTYASVFIGGTSYTVTIPNGCAGTYGNATILATGSTPLVFKDITTSTTLCTLTFGTGSGTAVVTGSGGTVSSGDLLSLTVVTADTTLAGVTAELAGTTPGVGGGGIGYPAGSGVPQVVSGTSWGTTYNASNLIPANFLSLIPLASGVSGILPVANGGTSSASPTLISGSGILISGTWPNQTVTATGGGGGGMIWPAGPGIASCTGTPCTSWLASYNSSNQIPANFVSTLNQSTTGNAATATSFASSPTTCSTGNAPIGILANGNSTGCAPIGSSVSGQVSGVIPLATSATAIGAQSHLDDGNTTASTITSTEPFAVSTPTLPAQISVAYNTGHPITAGPATGIALGPDSSAHSLLFEGNVNEGRICTASNGICSGSGGNFVNITGSITPTNCTVASGVCTTSGAVASVTIASIPGTYRHLHIVANGQTSGASASNLVAQFNADTASHYDWALVANGSASNSNGQTQAVVGVLTSTSVTSRPGTSVIDIADYAQTTFFKSANGNASYYSGNMVAYQTAAQWQATTAITSIKLFPLNGGDNFVTGTSFTIYGEN